LESTFITRGCGDDEIPKSPSLNAKKRKERGPVGSFALVESGSAEVSGRKIGGEPEGSAAGPKAGFLFRKRPQARSQLKRGEKTI